MADIKNLVEEIKKLTIVEVSELVKVLEEEFGVSAAAPVAVAAAPVAGAAPAAAAEEKTEFNVALKEVGANKIAVIKAVREITGLGLVDAKKLVDGVPAEIKKDIAPEEAAEIKKKLEDAGAAVEVK